MLLAHGDPQRALDRPPRVGVVGEAEAIARLTAVWERRREITWFSPTKMAE